jgi:hypothetical protein
MCSVKSWWVVRKGVVLCEKLVGGVREVSEVCEKLVGCGKLVVKVRKLVVKVRKVSGVWEVSG